MSRQECTDDTAARRGPLLTLFVAAVLLALLSGAAEAQALNVREHQITVSSANETTPTLGNDGTSDLVVYTMRVVLPDGSLAPGDIWYQRLTPDGAPTGPAIQVTADPTDDELNDVSGDYIVYTAYDSTTSMAGVIMLYRISTYQLTPAGAGRGRTRAAHLRQQRGLGGGSCRRPARSCGTSWAGSAPRKGGARGRGPGAARHRGRHRQQLHRLEPDRRAARPISGPST